MSAEIRRDYPALARSHAARAHARDGVVALRRRRGDARAAARSVARARLPARAAGVGGRGASRGAARSARRGQAHPVHGHAEPAQECRHACSRRTRACERSVPDAPPLVLAGHRTPASARWEARCEQPPLKGHVTITGYVDSRAEDRSLRGCGDAGAAVVRRRIRLAGARSDGVRRAGDRVVTRIAARSGGRRRRRRSIPTMRTGSRARCRRLLDGDAARRDRARRGAGRALQLGRVRRGGAAAYQSRSRSASRRFGGQVHARRH